eukprot:2872894-Amphidinium_carterae.2
MELDLSRRGIISAVWSLMPTLFQLMTGQGEPEQPARSTRVLLSVAEYPGTPEMDARPSPGKTCPLRPLTCSAYTLD